MYRAKDEDRKLLSFLEDYLTDHKKELFQRVLDQRTKHFTVVIEDIYQDNNSGALVRTCDCFGIQEVHIIQQKYNFKIAHAIARGAEKWLDLHVYDGHPDNTLACFEKLRQEGYQIVATSPHQDECTLDDFDIQKKSAFVFGSEKEGISQSSLDDADVFLKIPMMGFTESLNVSVSAAVVLHQLTKALKQHPDIDWALSEEEKFRKKLEWTLKTIPNSDSLRNYFYQKQGIEGYDHS